MAVKFSSKSYPSPLRHTGVIELYSMFCLNFFSLTLAQILHYILLLFWQPPVCFCIGHIQAQLTIQTATCMWVRCSFLHRIIPLILWVPFHITYEVFTYAHNNNRCLLSSLFLWSSSGEGVPIGRDRSHHPALSALFIRLLRSLHQSNLSAL